MITVGRIIQLTEKAHASPRKRAAPMSHIRIGANHGISIYASTEAEIGLPLVEIRYRGESVNLTVAQAEEIAAALIAAASRARS